MNSSTLIAPLTVSAFSSANGNPMTRVLEGAVFSLPTEGGGDDSVIATAIATATSIGVAPFITVGMVDRPSVTLNNRNRMSNRMCHEVNTDYVHYGKMCRMTQMAITYYTVRH